MIGVYDSGLGGLLQINKVIKDNPEADILYLGDQKNAPYGTKTKAELLNIFEKNVEIFKNHGVKDLILACNTLCSNVDFSHDYGIKLHDIITSTIGMMDIKKDAKVLVFATKLTIKTKRYAKELELAGFNDYRCESLEKLAGMLENYASKEELRAYLFDEFAKIDYQPDAIILGCTHFPIVREIFEEYYHARIFDSTMIDMHIDDRKGEGKVYLLMEKSEDLIIFLDKYVEVGVEFLYE